MLRALIFNEFLFFEPFEFRNHKYFCSVYVLKAENIFVLDDGRS